MDNNITIGDLVRLDRRTRSLSRTHDGKSVMLPTAACRCLAALAQAKEQVLSQEQLMDIGWRHAGVEVTDNSVRVMITKIRRALVTLKVDERIQLIAVTRSGYRLIVRADRPGATDLSAAKRGVQAARILPAAAGDALPVIAPRSRLQRRIAAGVAGLVLGSCAVAVTGWLLTIDPVPVHYIRWYDGKAPPQSEVWVPEKAQPEKQQVIQTLQLYTQFALNKEGDINAEHARYLYITTGKSSPHLGLIACVTPLRDSENNCESYSFTYR
ncbi:Putative transcriptional regulatory protein [Erwinia sp. Ejp617]|nr:winged helix-turn-helix domain-containing protein [Erwinia sp. Ejp617]ADP09821.1 Putative transcriptional regulatory protein [Erwinia sp. Ejp617]